MRRFSLVEISNALPFPMLEQVQVSVFFLFFSSSVSEGLFFYISFSFRGPSGVPNGSFFVYSTKNAFFNETGTPSSLHTFIISCLDSEGLGPPGASKNEEEQHSKNHFCLS